MRDNRRCANQEESPFEVAVELRSCSSLNFHEQEILIRRNEKSAFRKPRGLQTPLNTKRKPLTKMYFRLVACLAIRHPSFFRSEGQCFNCTPSSRAHRSVLILRCRFPAMSTHDGHARPYAGSGVHVRYSY